MPKSRMNLKSNKAMIMRLALFHKAKTNMDEI